MAMIPGGAGLLQTLIVAFQEAGILGFPDADQMEQLYGLANRGGQRRLGHGLSQGDAADDCFKDRSRERVSIETTLHINFTRKSKLVVEATEECGLCIGIASDDDGEGYSPLGDITDKATAVLSTGEMTSAVDLWERLAAVDAIEQLSSFLATWARHRRSDFEKVDR